MTACLEYPLVRALDAWVELRQTITSPWNWQSAISNLLVISSHVRESTEDSLGFWIPCHDCRFQVLESGSTVRILAQGLQRRDRAQKVLSWCLEKIAVQKSTWIAVKICPMFQFCKSHSCGRKPTFDTCSRNLCHATSSKILKVHKCYTSLTHKGSWFVLVPFLT